MSEATTTAAATTEAPAKPKPQRTAPYKATTLAEFDRFRKDLEAAQKRLIEAQAKHTAAVKELVAAKAALATLDAKRPWR